MNLDPIQVEVWRHMFDSVAEEMGATLERTAYSPNIKERRDHSCAFFDAQGRLVAQAAHIPVHLGAMPLMMETLLAEISWKPGSMWICNDPRHGGTHLPDFTLVAPVYSPVKELVAFVANRAHHADIGGLAPGSLPLSTELFHEGIILPPVRMVVGNRIQHDVLSIICANSRTGNERQGDLSAQIAANNIGIVRLQELIQRYGLEEIARRQQEAREYASRIVGNVLDIAKPGRYSFEDVMESDGHERTNLPIKVTAGISDGRITFDFTGTALETKGPINATEAVTRSACYYVVRCLMDEDIPMNAGTFERVEVVAPEGTLVNSRFPRAVAAGNVETSQRIVDVLLGALATAFPEKIPAASQGTMNNLLIGGADPIRGGRFAYYETICGGAGAASDSDGAAALHSHMTNTRNTPIESLEMHYPLRVKEYSIRKGSSGNGKQVGGNGVVRSVELLAPAHVSVISERRSTGPYGLDGGSIGAPGVNTVQKPGGSEEEMASKFSEVLPEGTIVTIQTPGGGGYGSPSNSGD